MNWIDSAISYVAPATGLRRVRARLATQALLGYEGASVGRRTAGWVTSGTSANAEVGPALVNLRARSRDLVRNNPYAARAVDELVGQTIGSGIQAQAKTLSDAENKRIDRTWQTWIEECDADGQLDFYGIQDLATRTVLESGECLIRYRPRRREDGFLVPMQIQVMEPDHLDHSKTERTPVGYIIQGVEFDLVGRRIAYWIFDEHPGDVISTSRFGNLASRRHPANEIVHIYRKRRGHQVRGVPMLAPVILALRDLDEYQDAERVRKKIEACLSLFVSAQSGGAADPLGTTTTEDGTNKRIEQFRPGMVVYGQEGQSPTFFAPTGSGGYAEYVRQNERTIATGIGLTYEQLTGDLSNVNYSSYRAGLLSFRAGVESFRWLCLTPMFLRPVRRKFIEQAYAAGQITDTNYQTEWTPPAFGSVDPLKDAKAAELDLALGRMTWPQAVKEYGFDPETQATEIEKWKDRLAAAGVTFSKKGVVSDAQEEAA